MIQKIKKIANLISNMGFRYLSFRVIYMIKSKLGFQKKAYPINPKEEKQISLEDWKTNLPPFFFYGKNIPNVPKEEKEILKQTFEEIQKGIFTFFNKTKIKLGTEYNWMVNPTTEYRYNSNKHWSEVVDLSKEAGDIKYVWEKARFSFLYDVIRYDYHFEDDQSAYVLSEIEDFITKNPINQGPNYKCSQEISLRVMNWTFALYYYKDSPQLTEAVFQKIMHNIYWQIHHVYQNIHFSRITVRNNHAITETLLLYLSGKLFPFLPNVAEWSKKGKKWFEQEIEYQIYEDGTFLQFSMNYHRVVIQLLTWGIQLAKLHNDKFIDVVYERAQKSLNFLDACMDPVTGKLPNYGSNDGALFFKLTNDDYRVYRSQLDDLRAVLNGYTYFTSESSRWYGIHPEQKSSVKLPELNTFEKSGYYIIQDENCKTFIRCGAYKDRPFQSDNLHLDIWANGINYLRDTGSYKYNAELGDVKYFNGTEGHNTISVAKEDQMLKGGRFIWYYWVKKANASVTKEQDIFKFDGTIKAFKQLGNNILHTRKVTKKQGQNHWEVTDSIQNQGNKNIYQYWHLHPDHVNDIEISTTDKNGEQLEPLIEEKWFSGYYGVKEKSIRLTFASKHNVFNTSIRIKQ
ncbi:Heparin-sulfate lyase [Kordia antarctica]|uniref:Heparin-sulfate lyase n=1 Tax=Kordia antarctica TaxID=1218801 RepID=A0A7L4ZLK9_9FLAO|nr:alginate lyase family protein [Kordia antarctica]QHI37455.1 Heparin-sulfate lyase [Kordia antarctica]